MRDQSTSEIRAHQRVVASGELVGEVVGVLVAGDAEFMHVRRYGPGHDDLYVPVLAIDHVEGDRVYLRIPWIELAAQPWHERPAGAVERRSTGTAGSSSSAA